VTLSLGIIILLGSIAAAYFSYLDLKRFGE